ncbi:hypothetical protein HPB49_016377 [Dermacentor silvarum]|uniref:Uncharacterized protein n=1 Tax=Dermacentor silvarum TaxID=543639 RepID=A0ACB8DQN0_DERSI|nr:hypothetical protein HPB49_016377 [Dermacentor silvarum]
MVDCLDIELLISACIVKTSSGFLRGVAAFFTGYIAARVRETLALKLTCVVVRRLADMAGLLPRRRYTVSGFGSHVEMRTVEFVDKLEHRHACAWCNAVSSKMSLLGCRHVICDTCKGLSTVWIDRTYKVCCCSRHVRFYVFELEIGHPGDKRVRCINADSGCNFVGRLGDLNEHLRDNCTLYSETCSKCADTIVYKDLRKHYIACSGRPAVSLRVADARSLLENLGVACSKLEQAVASARSDDCNTLQDTVGLVREQFARIQGQLDMGAPWSIDANNIPRLDK